MSTALVIHGHFYQPPRENPWTETIDPESSAHPYHNWNERIYHECYRANAYARIVDRYDRVAEIVNNYENISYNIGPTLFTWLEQKHPRTYARILEADRRSCEEHNGHGNAIAQAYNHAILPLCNDRDRLTQIRWGLADFRYRYGRKPEALWLPETGCNHVTLESLIDEGLKFVILSPYQAQRWRASANDVWHDVTDGSIDTGVAYKYLHRDGSGRSIAIFFYDATIARAVAFEGALTTSQALVDLVSRSTGGSGRIVHTATDGESYGHHAHFADRSLAYALEKEALERGFCITNYGEYLERHPPTREADIKPGPNGEGTAWSCAHGVGRWCRDCGCSTGGHEGWNQAWRSPLRSSLDVLRDAGTELFENECGGIFSDPWAIRDAYIELLLDRSQAPEDFLRKHTRRRLRGSDRVRALSLLELQRNSLLMYTSCGWFFSDISGIETVQVMKYAGRVMDLFDELGVTPPRDEFLERLGAAESNVSQHGTGADIYRRHVEPARVRRRVVLANLAFSSLVDFTDERGETCAHAYEISGFDKQQLGRLTLATGRMSLESARTGKQLDGIFAAIHFGGVDFYCVVRPFPGADRFARAKRKLWETFRRDSLPKVLRVAQEEFGPDEFGLEHVLPNIRQRISEIVFANLINHFSEEYAHLYEENHRTLAMLHSAGFELPAELRVAAEFTLGRRFEEEIRRQNGSLDTADYRRALEIAAEVNQRGLRIQAPWSTRLFGDMIAESATEMLRSKSEDDLQSLLSLINLARRLGIQPSLDRAQEVVYDARDELNVFESKGRLIESLDLSLDIFNVKGRVPTT